MIVKLPDPPRSNDPRYPAKYDAENEAQTRRMIEQAFGSIPKSSAGPTPGPSGTVLPHPGAETTPSTPVSTDDEMITATTGYDPAKWSAWSHGSEVYALDPLRGLKITPDQTSTMRGRTQAVTFGADWGFEAKVCLGGGESASNSHIGIFIMDSSTGAINWVSLSRSSGMKYGALAFNSPSGYSGSDYFGTGGNPAGTPYGWHYVRIEHSGSGTYRVLVSQNGAVWLDLGSSPLHAAAPDTIGFFTYFADNPGPSFIQYIRRYK